MHHGRFRKYSCVVVAFGLWAVVHSVFPSFLFAEEAEQNDGTSEKKKRTSRKSEEEGESEKASRGGVKRTAVKDGDLQYVKDHLEEFLSPTDIEWHENGRVSLEFDLRERYKGHSDMFTPPVAGGGDTQSPFRWSFKREGGERGLRISDEGIAFFGPWYVDDVKVEIDLFQYSTFRPRTQLAAILFGSSKKALLANYGSETAFLIEGQKRGVQGKPRRMEFDVAATCVLRVDNGVFYGERDGYRTPERKYIDRAFDSGQIGLIWGGSIAATVSKFNVTGRLDTKKTAEVIRRSLDRSR